MATFLPSSLDLLTEQHRHPTLKTMASGMPNLPPFVENGEARDVQLLGIDVTANAATVLSNLRREDCENEGDNISFGRGGSFSDDDDVDNNGATYSPAERHFINNNQSVKVLIVLCRGMKDSSGDEVIDLEKAPWNTIDRKDKPIRSDYQSEVKRRWMAANPSANKLGPRPKWWDTQKCFKCLDENPIADAHEVKYLKEKIEEVKEELIAAESARAEEVAAAAGVGPRGKNWTGLVPPLRLFRAILDVDENKRKFMQRNACPNGRSVVDNRGSDAVREPTAWEVISDTVNSPEFNPKSGSFPEELHEDFMEEVDLSFERFSEYEPATPAKCQERFEEIIVKMKHCRTNYAVSGQGESGIRNSSRGSDNNRNKENNNPAGVEVDTATRQANLLRRDFLMNYPSYVLYYWIMLEGEGNELLLTSIEQLGADVAATNGASGVPSLARRSSENDDDMVGSSRKSLSKNAKNAPSASAVALGKDIRALGDRIENTAKMEANEKRARSLQSRVDSLEDSKRKFKLDMILLAVSNPAASAYYTQEIISIESQILEKEREIKRLRATAEE